MKVNKNLLIQKTNKELEDYLKPNKGYVIDAIEYAVEILKERGYEFTDEQNAYLAVAFLPEEKKEVHKDYITASNLILASAGIGIISFLYGATTTPDFSVFGGIVSLLVISGVGVFARTGSDWLKYLLLAFALIWICFLPIIIPFYQSQPIVGLVSFVQTILQIVAIIFLFKAPKEKPKWKDIFDN